MLHLFFVIAAKMHYCITQHCCKVTTTHEDRIWYKVETVLPRMEKTRVRFLQTLSHKEILGDFSTKAYRLEMQPWISTAIMGV